MPLKKILLPLLLAGSSLLAFDTRTHVWIAQEVINDLEDGKVTIAPFGEFSVDPEVASAILENKSTYRMGNIGPDGFPDVVAGQVTVHPGLEDGDIGDDTPELVTGWKSDTWFQWVLSKAQTPQEKAFAYGFLGHGAADTFAHTYVNMYAGDIFDMNDGETDVEKRHIFLEKYISDRLPAFKDNNGIDLGEAYQLVAVDDELPITFIKNTLLMNEEVSKQYALSSTASYLKMMYDFRQKVAALDDEDTEATVDNDLSSATRECDDTSWYPGKYLFSIFSSHDETCEEKNFLTQKRERIAEIKQKFAVSKYSYKKAWLTQIDHAIDEYIKASSRMSRGFMDVNGGTYTELTDWISCYSSSFTDPTTLGSKTVEDSCQISNEIKEKLSFLDDVKAQSDFTILSGLKSEVKGLSQGLGSDIIELMGVAALEIITVKEQSVSHDSLNEQFGMDESEKHLLLISDISERVEAEMALQNGHLDPKHFKVLYNAVVLSKLSLLPAEEINRLIQLAGAESDYQYAANTSEPFSVLFGAIKTIDGNHQWLRQAPPYPRMEGFNDQTEHFYGYKNTTTKGFKLYAGDTMHFELFNKVFKGPLALGLQTPEAISMGVLLASDYPYRPSVIDPFPDFNNYLTIVPKPEPEVEESWLEKIFTGLKKIIMDYFYELVGKENIISLTETNESIKIITTVPNNGITF